MEEVLELAIIIIIAVVGIVSKVSKDNKKKQAANPGSTWDELGSKISSGVNKVIEIMDEDDGDRIKINIPTVAQKPAAVSVEAVQPVANAAVPAAPVIPKAAAVNESGSPAEGDCDHPLHKPAERPAAAQTVKPRIKAPATQPEQAAARNGVLPERLTAAQLRQAVVMNEVLGKPVALRGTARR